MEKEIDLEKGEESISNIKREYIKQSKKYKSLLRGNNRFLVNFIVQVSMGFMVAIFCIIMLSLNPTKEEKLVYISLLGTIVGYFLPNPRLKK
jgi:hypothetical protein